MKCPRCEQENRAAAKFCDGCGTPLQRFEGDVEATSYVDVRQSLTEALARESAIGEILRVIGSSPTDVQPVFDAIAESAARLCESLDAVIWRRDGDRLRLVAHHGQLPQVSNLPLIRGTVAGRAVLDGRTIHVADVQTEAAEFPETSDLASRLGFRTILCVPLMREGIALGGITLRRAEAQPFTDRYVALLQTFADQAVIAIENVRLFNETKAALERQTATGEILRVISTSPTDLQPVLDAVVERAARLCVANDAVIFRDDGDTLTPVATCGVPAVSSVPRTRGTASGRAIVDRQPVHVEDLASPTSIAEFPDANVPRARGIRTQLAVPLLREGEAVGVILIRRFHVQPFTEQQIALLKTFADQAVIAIENVRLFKELEARNRDLTATSEILRVISSSPTDVQPVFEAVAASARRLCEGTQAALLTYDGALIHLATQVNAEGAFFDSFRRAFPMAPSRATAATRAILYREVIQVPDVLEDPEYVLAPTAQAVGFRSVVAVPMLREGAPIGVIVATRAAPGPFPENQVAVLKTFADQAVIAIENVRLFTELQRKNSALTEALDQQTATSDVLRVISSSQTEIQPVFETIVRNAVRLCEGVFGGVLRVEGDMLHLVADHNFTPEARAVYRQVFPIALTQDNRRNVSARAVIDRAIVHLSDIRQEPDFAVSQRLSEALKFRAILSVPMLRDGSVIGAISVARAEAGPFSESQMELLKTFADQAVIAIENVRLFKELQASNRELTESLEQQTATSEILRVISSSPTDVQPVFDTIVRSATRLCRAVAAAVFVTDGRTLYEPANYGGPPEALAAARARYPRPLDRETASGTAILTRSVVHVPDVEEQSATEFASFARRVGRAIGFRSLLAVPMLREGEAVGAINVTRSDPGLFSDTEVALLRTFADQAVIAIENVRLFTELQASNRELTTALDQQTATSDILRVISRSQTDVKPVFDAILTSAVRLLRGYSGTLAQIAGDQIELAAYTSTGAAGDAVARDASHRSLDSEGVHARTIRDRAPITVANLQTDPRFPERVHAFARARGFLGIITVPLLRHGEALGSIAVARREPGEFNTDELGLLQTFADQAVIAIENVRLFKELEAANRELAAASQHKSEFLANMSHELRTPLNAVIGFSEVLSERMFGELNEKQDEYLKDIHSSGQHLLSLINDILDLSKIEAGKMDLELTDFDLPMTIDNALMLIRERAARRGIELHRTVDERLGQVHADERKIRQVLLNLLSNAIKFTPEGGRIHVEARSVNESIEVSVTDTGVGIAPADQEAVFEEFRQVGTADKKVEGTGLGLALSRKFIELHGGKIWVESQVGEGSTFTFAIPVGRGG